METIVCNFHDDTSEIVGKFQLKGGDDADKATWMDLTASLDLFASHADFLRSVAYSHGASSKSL
jgi:ADP-ribose pyrophosphatase